MEVEVESEGRRSDLFFWGWWTELEVGLKVGVGQWGKRTSQVSQRSR